MTADDIELEHLEALGSLNPAQREAIHRNREALRVGNFSHHALRDVLADLFARDATTALTPEGAAPTTAEDIRRRHLDALASLTPPQRTALHRVERGYRQSHFSLRSFREILTGLFEAEAAERTP